MRKRHVLAWLLCAALLAGCQGRPEEMATVVHPISQEALSQDLREALEEEWEAWNALSEERQILSSHVPGWCQRGFEDWAACEDFLGFSVPIPWRRAAGWKRGPTWPCLWASGTPPGWTSSGTVRRRAMWTGSAPGPDTAPAGPG